MLRVTQTKTAYVYTSNISVWIFKDGQTQRQNWIFYCIPEFHIQTDQ
jgi:hypothetical protein